MISQHKIISHLWFDNQAQAAIDFYTNLFPDSLLISSTVLANSPTGELSIHSFKLAGHDFMAINAGPMFKINPSISFFVYCGSESEIDRIYSLLIDGGEILMPLSKYDWSSKYAWVQDKFGVSWQLDIDDINNTQKIVPSLLFANDNFGKMSEALEYYKSIFSQYQLLYEYKATNNFGSEETVFAQFKLNNTIFNAMNSHIKHGFDFNEAVSFLINCDNQIEIDYYWDLLSKDGQEQQCGWLKDKYGLSWQIVPAELENLINSSEKQKVAQMNEELLKMVKLDIAKLKNAFNS